MDVCPVSEYGADVQYGRRVCDLEAACANELNGTNREWVLDLTGALLILLCIAYPERGPVA